MNEHTPVPHAGAHTCTHTHAHTHTHTQDSGCAFWLGLPSWCEKLFSHISSHSVLHRCSSHRELSCIHTVFPCLPWLLLKAHFGAIAIVCRNNSKSFLTQARSLQQIITISTVLIIFVLDCTFHTFFIAHSFCTEPLAAECVALSASHYLSERLPMKFIT